MATMDLSREDVERRVRTVVAEELGVEMDDVEPRARLAEDLGANSLDLLELRIALEEEFGVGLGDRSSVAITTVGRVVGCLVAALGLEVPTAALADATGHP